MVLGIEMDFGSKLKSIRKLNDLSQEQMADLLFTTQWNYSQYENNNRVPSIDLLKRLIDQFDLDANWLLSGSTEQVVNFNDNSSCNIVSLKTENFNHPYDHFEQLQKKVDDILTIISKNTK